VWEYTRVLSTAAGKTAKGGPGEGSNRRHMRGRRGGVMFFFRGGGMCSLEQGARRRLKLLSEKVNSRPHTLVAEGLIH
jgi:hypothetical protein